MEKIIIEGQHRLEGEVTISGAKNSALAILTGTILTDSECTIKNLPNIKDVAYIKDMLLQLGAKVTSSDDVMTINTSGVNKHSIDFEMAKKMRASYYFL
ncbi:MAG: murA3, partial [Clostridia bacterium]|nr:murA3 [Clostridia bacterium]